MAKSKRKAIIKKKKIKKKKLTKKLLKKKLSKKKKVIKSIVPVSIPVGSVHFDKFLKKCKSPKLNLIPIVEIKTKKKGNKKTGKEKKSKKTKKRSKTKNLHKIKKRRKLNKRVKTKKRNIKNNKNLKTKNVFKPIKTLQSNEKYSLLFPLIKALLLPTDDDPLKENTLFSVRFYYITNVR